MPKQTHLLLVERFGGLARFGAAGSHIRSKGQLALNSLPASEQQLVEVLFKTHGKQQLSAPPSVQCDTFSYKISCASKFGAKTIEVPEAALPATIIACVKDELV
jgi:hypothetical protein